METITKHHIPSVQTITKHQAPITKYRCDLEERTSRFAKDVTHLCQTVKADLINRERISQLVRASGSVGAHDREANDALSTRDFGHHMDAVLVSNLECGDWSFQRSQKR